MKAELTNGEIVELEKDCGCIIHEGPHWLHMDAVDKDLNQQYLRPDFLSLHAFAAAEQRRLEIKLREMESRGIARIIREENP